MLRDALEGLHALHTNNVCHGSVNLESFLVEEVDGQFRGRLGFYPFNNPVRLKLFFCVNTRSKLVNLFVTAVLFICIFVALPELCALETYVTLQQVSCSSYFQQCSKAQDMKLFENIVETVG